MWPPEEVYRAGSVGDLAWSSSVWIPGSCMDPAWILSWTWPGSQVSGSRDPGVGEQPLAIVIIVKTGQQVYIAIMIIYIGPVWT